MYEIARLAETSPCVVAASLRSAVTLGLIVEHLGDRISFMHERVRDAALAALDRKRVWLPMHEPPSY